MPAKVMLLAVGLGVGGTETHILELAARIDRSRFSVIVCSLKPGGKVADELRARGIKVVSLNGMGKLDVRVFPRLLKVLSVERPDVIQSFLFWANLAARVCGRIFRAIPVISSYHDEIVSEGRAVRLIDRLTLKWTSGVVCCSEAVRRSVTARIGGISDRCAIIPFGVETHRYESTMALSKRELGLREDQPVIGTVCRLVEPKKGLSVLLQAAAELKRRDGGVNFQLLIVGDGPARSQLEELSRRLDLDSQIVFAGARRDIQKILPLVNVFVLPSLYEGFGIAILEALAAGRPVVATTVGGIPEFVKGGKTGLLVEPGNANALADAIATLLNNPEEAKQLGRQGQDYVRGHCDIAGVVRQHEQIYEGCLVDA